MNKPPASAIAADWNRAVISYTQLRQSPASSALPHFGMLFENSDSGGACQLREHFLQAMWNEQCFTGPLETADHAAIEVISPGTWNLEQGPDFRNAVIRIGGRAVYGDVEIHRHVRDWDLHGHGTDPGYGNVILHAVWHEPPDSESDRGGRPPCFIMKKAVQGHWRALTRQIAVDEYPYARQVGPGLCAVNWSSLSDDQVRDVLRVAGLARFHEKTAALQMEIIKCGAEQAAYEALFRALGYKANGENLRALAKAVPLKRLHELADADSRAAALFGVAGLLPDPTRARPVAGERRNLRKLWDLWWASGMTPLEIRWARSGQRPYNSPERRLAAGCHLLEKWRLQPARTIAEHASGLDSASRLLHQLEDALACPGPWENLTSFEHRLSKPAALIGAGRANDIIVNVLLPLLAAYARQSDNDGLARLCRDAFLQAGRLQGNRPTTEVAHRLLVPPSRAKAVVHTACEQQGLLGLYRDFCQTLYGDCRNCPLSERREFAKLLPEQ